MRSIDELMAEAVQQAVTQGVERAMTELRTADDRGLYREKDAAEWLGVGQTKLREWVDAGLVKRRRLDGCVRYARQDLEAFITDRWTVES